MSIQRKLRRNLGAAVLMCLLLCCSACAKAPPGQAELALGTKCSVNLYEYGSPKLYSRVFERIREIDRTMSARKGVLHSQLSTVMLINHNAGIAPVKVGADLFEVLEKALYYAELSNGAFDPTVGPLVNAWGIGTETENIPDKTSIDQALALINRKDVILDREQGTAYLQRKGMELDLGAIVKGYAADEAVRIAGEAQAGHAIIDLGGNIAAMGSRGSGKHGIAASPWRIGIQDPLAERNVYIGMVLVSDKSVVTSGVYERYFEQDGKRYHHILSTQDGYPVDNGLLSVTIIADRSIDADGLSTAVFALGFQQGLNLLRTIPGTEAIFIFDNRSVYLSGGLINSFILTTDKYTIIDTIRAETVMDRP